MSEPPSKKRVADTQITQNDPESEVDDDNGVFQTASQDVLAARRIVKAKRPTGPKTTAPKPTRNVFENISFTVPAPATDSAQKEEAKADDSIEAKLESKPGAAAIPAAENGLPEEEVDSKPEEKGVPSEAEDKAEDVADRVATDEAKASSKDETGATKSANGVEESSTSRPESAQATTNPPSGFSLFSGSGSSPFSSASGSSFGFFSTQSTIGFGAFSSSGSSFSFQSSSSIFSSSSGFFPPSSLTPGLFDSSNGSSPSLEPTPDPSFTPVVTLKEVKVETGEENEKSVFSEEGAFFEFVDQNWKKYGKGVVKVNIPLDATEAAKEEKPDQEKDDIEAQKPADEETDKPDAEKPSSEEGSKPAARRFPRVVMRASGGNYRILLNSNLYPGMTLKKNQSRVDFLCLNNVSENSNNLGSVAIRFKDESIAEAFIQAVHANLPPKEE